MGSFIESLIRWPPNSLAQSPQTIFTLKNILMAFFTVEFTNFFKSLAQNNNRDWFIEHKKTYENEIKKPFEAFVSHMLAQINEVDPSVQITAKDAILRINRDIRFSKDKTPYNLHRTAFLSAGGRKNKSIPGLFLRLSPEMVGIMAGAFQPSKEQLHQIRYTITKNPKKLDEIINNESFKEKFSSIKGEQNKRIPKEFQAAVESYPIIANKQFYLMAELSPDWITREDFADELMTYFHAAKPFNDYLLNAMQS